MALTIHDRGRALLRDEIRRAGFDRSWPEFMQQSPVGPLFYGDLEPVAAYQLVAMDGDDAVAAAYSMPFTFGIAGREQLPDTGWDEVIRWGVADRRLGRTPNAATALEIVITPERKGDGLSAVMLKALRDNAFGLGHDVLYAPVRPSLKSLEPQTPMADYAFRVRDDGLPYDPWLRVHVRAGGRIIKVAPVSMTIPGTLADWRSWTGLPFDTDGPVTVEGALSPVLVSVTHDSAVYIEPNVWIEHRRAPAQ